MTTKSTPAKPMDPTEWINLARTEIADAQATLRLAEADLNDAVRYAVDECGWTWADVSDLLGTTRQAAHERFTRTR